MKHIITLSMLLIILNACTSALKDQQAPEILSAGDETCPLNCQEFTPGGLIEFAYLFRDNVELGNFNIEIHSNFDHHTHGTESADCEHEEEEQGRTPVNPWVYNRDFSIPSGQTQYKAQVRIPIPEDVDEGEYHFMIRLTDAAGWQSIRSLAIHLTSDSHSL